MKRHFPGSNPLANKVKQVLEDDGEDDKPEVAVPTSRMLKRRNMDAFLEELKQEHGNDGTTKHRKTAGNIQPAEEIDPSDDQLEQFSTNVFIANLPPHVNEVMIAEEFGDFGPIGSVKVMWPRTKEQFERQRNTGFILFMDRSDAEDAFNEMQGVEVWGVPLSLHWGKPVPKPDKPMFVTPAAARKQSRKNQLRAAAKKNDPSIDDSTLDAGKDIPLDVQFKEEASDEGEASDTAKSEKSDDDDISDDDDDDLLSDDSDTPHAEKARRKRRTYPRGPLLEKDKKILNRLLRDIDLSREKIKETMVFCIEHSDAAYEVLDNIVGSLLVETTPVFPKKLGRLYLLSDLLHNSGASVPNAWKYRSGLEKRLPKVFESLGKTWKAIESRLKAEQMRKFVMAVVGIWESWLVFSKDFTDSLRVAFTQSSSGRQTSSTGSAPTSQAGSLPGTPPSQQGASNEEDDKKQTDDDVDGVPLNAGQNNVEENDFDGVPLVASNKTNFDDDEDLDGVPLQTMS